MADGDTDSKKAVLEKALQFGEFEKPTYEQWHDAAVQTLRGAAFDQKLVTRTFEDISVQPIYSHWDIEEPTASHEPSSFVRGSTWQLNPDAPWGVCQEFPHANPKELNIDLEDALHKGLSDINIVVSTSFRNGTSAGTQHPIRPLDDGLILDTLADVNCALNGIDLSKHRMMINAYEAGFPIGAMIVAHVLASGQKLSELNGCVSMSPISQLTTRGELSCSIDALYDEAFCLSAWATKNTPDLRTIFAQGHSYHNAGANAVQELAFAFGECIEYMQALTSRGLTASQAASQITLGFSVGADFFKEISKIRAAKALFANVVKAFGGDEDSQRAFLYARTSRWNQTKLDPHSNILRSTTETLSAAIAGADMIHTSPFDECFATRNQHSARIARNTQTILNREASAGRVLDPAGGAWFVESMTSQLASKAWELLQQVESQGGMMTCLKNGFVQEQISTIREKRLKNLACRKDVLVGTNMFANMEDESIEIQYADKDSLHNIRKQKLEDHQNNRNAAVLKESLAALGTSSTNGDPEMFSQAIKAVCDGATVDDILGSIRCRCNETLSIVPLPSIRAGKMFEDLRNATDHLATTGENRPSVFLMNVGRISELRLRVDFCRGFFETGGFEVRDGGFLADVAEGIEAAQSSNAPIVVFSSTDANYPEMVPVVAQKLKDKNPNVTVVLAGNPGDKAAQYLASGVDEFIYLRCNAHEVLSQLLRGLGVFV